MKYGVMRSDRKGFENLSGILIVCLRLSHHATLSLHQLWRFVAKDKIHEQVLHRFSFGCRGERLA